MSGFYIHGMEMPTFRDDYVAIVIYGNGTIRSVHGYVIDGATAIPVPPHGRLIDADALRQSIKESIDECHAWAEEVNEGEMYARVSQALGTFVECSLRVKAAPTIIEAEEGE